MTNKYALIIILAATLSATAAHADRYVWTNSPTPGAGYQTWDTAAHTIQAAVAAGAAGETVWVTNGIYVLTQQITVANNVVLRSVNGPDVTIMDGNYPDYSNRCLYVNAATAVVDGFTIRNGCCTNTGIVNSGGGVSLYGQAPRLQNCVISGNKHPSESGGGVFIYLNGMVSNCTVVSNISYEYGGGIHVYTNGSVLDSIISHNAQTGTATYYGGGGVCLRGGGLLARSTVSNNVARYAGGGVLAYPGAGIVIRNCTIACNSNVPSVSYGGGVALVRYSEGAQLLDSTISNNAAGYGGGVMIWNGRAENCRIARNQSFTLGGGGLYLAISGEVFRCHITGNTAAGAGSNGKGGGLYLANGGRIRNCLIANNQSAHQGGGLFLYSIGDNGGWLSACTIVSNRPGAAELGGGVYCYGGGAFITNSILYQNANDDYYTDTAANTNRLWYCCLTNAANPNQGNITNAPDLRDVANADFRLARNSPCINQGANEPWMSTAQDLDGRSRIDRLSRRVDMGCFEHISRGTYFCVE